ncbi:MAG TPA: hypothetical protein VKX46_10015 [Ktedonobacteraceae bacterium]|nr:hypothetical protein [Ktedonobacteraceae bacterium]
MFPLRISSSAAWQIFFFARMPGISEFAAFLCLAVVGAGWLWHNAALAGGQEVSEPTSPTQL